MREITEKEYRAKLRSLLGRRLKKSDRTINRIVRGGITLKQYAGRFYAHETLEYFDYIYRETQIIAGKAIQLTRHAVKILNKEFDKKGTVQLVPSDG